MPRGLFGRRKKSSRKSKTKDESSDFQKRASSGGGSSDNSSIASSSTRSVEKSASSDVSGPTTKSLTMNSPAQKPRRHMRRNSFGDASIGTASSEQASPRQKVNSARFINSRKSFQKRQKSPPEIQEEEKKEIHSGDEVEEEDDFFESPEFRNRVAHEAADLDKEGNTYFERGDYDQAFMSYERALKLKRASLQTDQAKKGTQEMLTETESQKASILASVATSINNMTYLRQRAGQASADETMAAYLKSLQIKREILGPNHLSVGKTLNNIGSVFYLKKEYVPALKAYENANEIMAEQLGEQHLDVGTVLSNIGDVQSAMGNKKEALEYYRRALNIRWHQLGRNDPKVIRLMEMTAALETGKQPRKKEDDLSDSENEEYAQQDRAKRQEFQNECQALQEELVEDIKFFDLVERTLAIELVKQKTKFMRAMRKIQTGGSIRSDMFESSDMFDSKDFDDDDGSDSSISVMSAPPDLDLDDDSGDEAPEVLAFLQEIGANPVRKPRQQQGPRTPTRTPTKTASVPAMKTTPSGSASRAKTPNSRTKAPASRSKTPTPTNGRAKTPTSARSRTPTSSRAKTPTSNRPRTPTSARSKTPNGRSSTSTNGRSITPSPGTRTPSSRAKPKVPRERSGRPSSERSRTPVGRSNSRPTTPTTPNRSQTQPGSAPHTPNSARQVSERYPMHSRRLGLGNNAPYRKIKSSTTLTDDERRLALMAVKERVATLRSNRELEALDPEQAAEAAKKDLIKPKRQVYLDATRSPTGKSAASVVK